MKLKNWRYMKILKWNFIWKFLSEIHMNNLKCTIIHGKGFYKIVERNIFSIHLDLKTLPSIGQWWYFRTRGPRSSRTFELHYIAIIRQVHQTQVYEPKFILAHVHLLCFKSLNLKCTTLLHLSQMLSFINGGRWNHGLYCTIRELCGGDSIVPGMMNKT